MSSQNKGILLAFITSLISGLAIFYGKISVSRIPPLVLTASRNFYVGVVFLLLFLISGKIKELKKLKRKQTFNLIVIGLIGGALPFYLFFTGLQSMSALKANLIQKSLFIWVTVLAVIFLKEKINISYVISFILIFVANFLIGGLKLSFAKGELLVISATFLWSIENILAKKVLKDVSSETVGLFRMGIGGILLMSVTMLTSKAAFFSVMQKSGNLAIIFVGGSILFFYVFTWYKALRFAPASLVTLILTFAVVVGNILNGSFVNVRIPAKDMVSSVLISVAMLAILFPYLSKRFRVLPLK